MKLVLGSSGIRLMVLGIDASRYASEIFNDYIGIGHGVCIAAAICCEHAIARGCLRMRVYAQLS